MKTENHSSLPNKSAYDVIKGQTLRFDLLSSRSDYPLTLPFLTNRIINQLKQSPKMLSYVTSHRFYC